MSGLSRLKVALCIALAVAAAVWSLNPVARAAAPSRAAHHPAKLTCKKVTKSHGLVRLSDWEFPDTLNPYQGGIVVDAWLSAGFQEQLFRYDNHSHLFPQMATNLPTTKNGEITNGGKTYTVHLKPGMRWSNGTPITAQDVVFSWKMYMDPASGGACSQTCDNIARIDTKGSNTLIFHMKTVYAPALDYAVNGFNIVPQSWPGAWNKGDVSAAANKFFTDQSFNYENSSYITDGPYQVKQFINNDRILLAPMKYYRTMTCGPNMNNVIFAFYSSKPGMIAAAAAKQTDITEDYTAADLPTLQKNNAYKTIAVPSYTFEHLEFNVDSTYNGSANPVSNANVRVALALALDKLGLIQSALGLPASTAKSIEAWTPLVNTPSFKQPYVDTKITGQWDPIAKKYQSTTGSGQALADAKTLLSKTPYASGFSLDFYTTSGNPVRAAQASVVQASWAKIGVKVNVNYVPASKLFATTWTEGGVLDHGTFQVGMFAYSGAPDPAQLLPNLVGKFCDRKATVHSGINANDSCMNDPTINKYMVAAGHSLNKSVRAKDYALVQEALNKNAYWIQLFYRPAVTTSDGRVAPFSENPVCANTTCGSTWNIYAWKVVKS